MMELSEHSFLAFFVLAIALGMGWTLGCWIMSTILAFVSGAIHSAAQ